VTGDATTSALLIPATAAEPVVARWREQLDPASALGVPAHVTVLYPFVEPRHLSDDVFATVAQLVRSEPAFAYTLGRVCWFGDIVAYLAPEPDQPFRRLTSGLAAAFPAYPPYGGVHDDVVPHLTIGDGGEPTRMLAAVEAVEVHLPVHDAAEEVWLMTGSNEPRSWTLHHRFPLAHS
jgi:2'-5' RNA ligase